MAAQAAAAPSATRYRVAIADDHLDMRQLLTLRLNMVPALEVIGEAANGADAISLANKDSADLMILDLNMPLMGGAEAIPLLRAAAPRMRIVVFSSDPDTGDLTGGRRPDAILSKGASLADLVATVLGLLAEGPDDVVRVDLGRLPVQVVVDAFDTWVGLSARVRHAIAKNAGLNAGRLGDVPVDASDLRCLMGVFMQMGRPLREPRRRGDTEVDIKFAIRREAGAAARRALLALGGNGTLRALNQAWSLNPTPDAQEALDLVDSRLVDQLPVS